MRIASAAGLAAKHHGHDMIAIALDGAGKIKAGHINIAGFNAIHAIKLV